MFMPKYLENEVKIDEELPVSQEPSSAQFITSPKIIEGTITRTTINQVIIDSIEEGSDLQIQGWQFNGAFSATDADTVAWGAGTLTMGDGQTFAIGASNTGNMAAITYIYFAKDEEKI